MTSWPVFIYFILPTTPFFPAIFQDTKNSLTLNLTELALWFFHYTHQCSHCSKSLTSMPESYRECVLFIWTKPMTFSSILIMNCILHRVPSVHNEQIGSNCGALWDKTTFPLRSSTFKRDVLQNRQCWHDIMETHHDRTAFCHKGDVWTSEDLDPKFGHTAKNVASFLEYPDVSCL